MKKFNFQKAARQILLDHPEKQGDMVFVNLNTDTWQQTEEILTRLCDERDGDEEEIKEVKDAFTEMLAKDSSTLFPTTFGDVLIFSPNSEQVFAPEQSEEERYGIFYHEFAHALKRGKTRLKSENIADAYSVLRLHQDFGNAKAARIVKYLGNGRCVGLAYLMDAQHFTTPLVDKIVVDARTRDFRALTPAQTLKLAVAYANRFTPTQKELKDLRQVFMRTQRKRAGLQTLKSVGNIALRAPTNSLRFYTAARLFAVKTHAHFDTWAELRAKILKRVEKLPKRHPLRPPFGL